MSTKKSMYSAAAKASPAKSVLLSQQTATSMPAIGKNVGLPPLPSNMGPDNCEAEFNSIGYYGDLLSRLDSQIVSMETVYKKSFHAVQE